MSDRMLYTNITLLSRIFRGVIYAVEGPHAYKGSEEITLEVELQFII